MKSRFFRQLIALALLVLLAPTLHAQFQKLYDYGAANPKAGIFKDVQCIENAAGNNPAIVAVGTDNAAPLPNGIIAFHTVAGNPLNYLVVSNPNGGGRWEDGTSICQTPVLNRMVSCFYDPVSKATDVVNTTTAGAVQWIRRIPNFQVRDVVAGPNGLIGDRIWLTGNTTNGATPTVAVLGLNGGGGTVFYQDYILPIGYTNHIGFEIDFSTTTGLLTVIGKTSRTACQDGILAMRLDGLTGAVVWCRTFFNANCAYDLKGKALVRKAGGGPNYIVAFEYKDPIIAGAAYPGILEFDGAGNLVGNTKYYTGPGFFNGTNYMVDGLDTDGNSYLVSGTFTNGTNLQISGYSLNASNVHAGVQFNEYEMAGAHLPTESKLVDMDYFASQNKYVMGGHFKPMAGLGWPLTIAFWLVQTDMAGTGVSLCSNFRIPVDHQITPDTASLAVTTNARDGIVQYGLNIVANAANQQNQCTLKSDGSGNVEETLVSSTLAFAYLPGQGQILARIPAEAKGQVSLTLIDLQGRVMGRMNVGTGETRIDVSQWAAGVYFIQYQGEGIQAGVQKVAIR